MCVHIWRILVFVCVSVEISKNICILARYQKIRFWDWGTVPIKFCFQFPCSVPLLVFFLFTQPCGDMVTSRMEWPVKKVWVAVVLSQLALRRSIYMVTRR